MGGLRRKMKVTFGRPGEAGGNGGFSGQEAGSQGRLARQAGSAGSRQHLTQDPKGQEAELEAVKPKDFMSQRSPRIRGAGGRKAGRPKDLSRRR